MNFEIIKKEIDKWDPIDLLNHTPSDEYDMESREILPKFQHDIDKIAMIARTIVAAYEATKTAYECYQYGVGWGKSAFAGAAVFASSFMYGMTGDLLTDTVFDLTYGLGASLTAQMIAVETKKSSKHSEGITFYSTNSGKRYVGPIERMQYNRNSYIIPTSQR